MFQSTADTGALVSRCKGRRRTISPRFAASSMASHAPPGAPLRVVVAGGGVGGLSLAVALLSRGVKDVLVLERDESLSAAASRATALAFWPNGMRALRALAPALNLDKAVVHAGCLMAETRLRSGELSFASKDGASYEEKFGFPAVSLRWRDLVGALADALPPGCVRFGLRLKRYEPLPEGGVRATFVSPAGEETVLEADVLVGCDGLRSTTREQLFEHLGVADPCPPVATGRVAWRAVLPPSIAPPQLAALCGPVDGGDGCFTSMLSNVDNKTAAYMAVSPTGDRYFALGALSSDAGERLASEVFAHWPEAAACVAATPPEALLRTRLYVREPLDPAVLSADGGGPVTLLGDALHAMAPSLGQGACAAVEGALELAQVLASAPPGEGVPPALRRYERARLARVTPIQARSNEAGAASYRSKGDASKPGGARPLSMADQTAALYNYVSPHAEA